MVKVIIGIISNSIPPHNFQNSQIDAQSERGCWNKGIFTLCTSLRKDTTTFISVNKPPIVSLKLK